MIISRVSTVVGLDGFEPSTSRLSGARSNHLSYKPFSFGFDSLPSGGDDGNRTHDPLLAGQVLSQLSYTPVQGFSHEVPSAVADFKDLSPFGV